MGRNYHKKTVCEITLAIISLGLAIVVLRGGYKNTFVLAGQSNNVIDEQKGEYWIIFSKETDSQLIETAVGGSSIKQWQPEQQFYQNMAQKIPPNATAVLFWQGETDAAEGMSSEGYIGYLNTFADQVFNDFGIPTVVAEIGNDQGVEPDALDNIRNAQHEAWQTNPHILQGPSFKDLIPDDGVHFKSKENNRIIADRWIESLKNNGLLK